MPIKTRLRNVCCSLGGHRDYRYYSDGVRWACQCFCGCRSRFGML